jgi:hypothetical protein
VGGSEVSNPATATTQKRLVCWGDIAVGPVAFGAPLTLTPDATNTTMAKGRRS